MRETDKVREAVAASRRTLLTYDDYLRMPAGLRYEIVEGEPRMVPSPGVFHQEISKRLGRVLLEWIEGQDLGLVYNAPLDVILSEHNVVQPDLLYVSKERLGIIRKENIGGAPDLVVEILSPSTAGWDQSTKRRIYGLYGVRELWLVDPEGKSIEVAVWKEGSLITVAVYPAGSTLSSPLLPGFTMEVSRLFRS